MLVSKYKEVKKSLPENSFLFLRLGDFYEAFDEEAEKLSEYKKINKEKYSQPSVMNGFTMDGILIWQLEQYSQIINETIYILERAGKKGDWSLKKDIDILTKK